MPIRSIALSALLFVLVSTGSNAQSQLSDSEVRAKADALLAQMTVEEKAGQLNQEVGHRHQRIRGNQAR